MASSSGGSGSTGCFHPHAYIKIVHEGPDIVPKKLYSEKEYQNVMEKVSTGLVNEDDWEARIEALRLLQQVAMGDGMEFGSFPLDLKHMHEKILANIADLRSLVSKEASRTVAVLARRLGRHFAPLVELVVPTLLKLILVKIQVVREAAERSLRTVVTASESGYPRLLPVLVEMTSNKNALVRRYAIEYMCLAVANWPLDSMDGRGLKELHKALVQGVEDADPNARKASRQLFWAMHSHREWKSVMAKAMVKFSSSVQKHINAEGAQPTTDLMELLNPPALPVEGALPPKEEAAADVEGQDGRGAVELPKRGIGERPIKHTASSSSSRSGPKVAAAVADPSSTEHAGMSMTPGKVALSKSLQRKAASGVRRSREEVPAVPSTGGLKSGALKGPQRMASSNADAFSHEASGHWAGPNKATSTKAVTREPFTDAPPSPPHESPAPVVLAKKTTCGLGAPARSGLSALSGGGAKRILRQPPKQPQQPQPVSTAAEQTHPVKKEEIPVDREPTAATSTASAELGGSSMATLQKLAANQHWTQRLQALQEARARLASRSTALIQTDLSTLLDMTVTFMGDSNSRIASEATDALKLCVLDQTEVTSELIGTRLPVILPTLFARLADRRPAVRDQANDMLNAVRGHHDPVTLMAALAPRLTDVPDKIKTAVLQFLSVIIPHCSAYFIVPTNTSAFLIRMAAVLSGSQNSNVKPTVALSQACRRTLELVYRSSPQTVLHTLVYMPLQQQNLIKSQLESTVKNIHHLVVAAGRDAPSRPPPPPKQRSKSIAISAPAPAPVVRAPSPAQVEVAAAPVNMPPPALVYNSPTETSAVPVSRQQPQVSAAAAVAHAMAARKVSSPVSSPTVAPPPTAAAPTSAFRVAVDYSTDVSALLQHLQPTGVSARDKLATLEAVRGLVKQAPVGFWNQHCAQIVSVLLESFQPSVVAATMAEQQGAAGGYVSSPTAKAAPSVRLTGLSPMPVKYGEFPGTGEGDENTAPQACEADSVGDTVALEMSPGESMHWACKVLLEIVRHKAGHAQNFLELLVARLGRAVASAPVAVVLHCQQILIELAPRRPLRTVQLLVPLVLAPVSAVDLNRHLGCGRLLALTVIAAAVKHLDGPTLLGELPSIIPCALPLFGSALVDIRKAVVFLLVEVYMVVGDALQPYMQELPLPQQKLLTIYINRQIEASNIAT
jgi:hypothetical protein